MRKGFTIIELLMAVALTIVIGMLISMAFYNTQLASQRATSTLTYHIKGRAIMDLLVQDIGNAIIVNGGGVDSRPKYNGALLTATAVPGIALKTLLPVQRSHYQDPTDISDAAKLNKDGYYRHDVVQVGWYYAPATATLPVRIYRRVSKPGDLLGKSGNDILSDAHYTPAQIEAEGDVVTSGDIRKFRVTALTTSGGKIVGYNVSFWLTSAPDTLVTDALNFEGTNGARAIADKDNHIIVEFSRNIAVPAFTP